jgi:hypothetical protein
VTRSGDHHRDKGIETRRYRGQVQPPSRWSNQGNVIATRWSRGPVMLPSTRSLSLEMIEKERRLYDTMVSRRLTPPGRCLWRYSKQSDVSTMRLSQGQVRRSRFETDSRHGPASDQHLPSVCQGCRYDALVSRATYAQPHRGCSSTRYD